MDIIRAEIRELHSIIADVCGALMYSDDLPMIERNTAAMGSIYRDNNFTSFRSPLFTRVALQRVFNAHDISPTTIAHHWQYNISHSRQPLSDDI